MITLHAIYSDIIGTETILIENDGTKLTTWIRGVCFEGSDFDGLATKTETNAFLLNHGDLCDCTLMVDLPVRLCAPEGLRVGIIHSTIVLGCPNTRGSLESEDVHLKMIQPEFTIISTGTSGWFEDELLNLAKQLPQGFVLESCITCGLSDYSPYGHGCFGCLACFKDAKEDYRRVDSKQGIFAIWDRMTEFVQETYHCDQYEKRPKGRGYRG